jgi:hypothetical protein
LKIKENPSLSKNIPPKVHLELFGIFWNFLELLNAVLPPIFTQLSEKKIKIKKIGKLHKESSTIGCNN